MVARWPNKKSGRRTQQGFHSKKFGPESNSHAAAEKDCLVSAKYHRILKTAFHSSRRTITTSSTCLTIISVFNIKLCPRFPFCSPLQSRTPVKSRQVCLKWLEIFRPIYTLRPLWSKEAVTANLKSLLQKRQTSLL